MKGKNGKEPVARDMLKSLKDVNQYQMQSVIATNYTENSDYNTDLVHQPTIVSLLQRKIYPETQAINKDEIKVLVNNDELERIHSELEKLDSEQAKVHSELEKVHSEQAKLQSELDKVHSEQAGGEDADNK